MSLADTVLPLSYGQYSYISQQEFDLTTLSLDFQSGQEGEDELVLIFPSGEKRPLTDKGFASLCRVIQVPLSFAKRLKDDHNYEVLTYLQKQMSISYVHEPAVVVCDTRENTVLSITTKDYLLESIHAVCEMDKDILKISETSKATLTARSEDDAYLRYGFITKRGKLAADNSEYDFGHVFAYSLYGYEQPHTYQVAVRCDDMAVILLPFKPEHYSTSSSTFAGDLVSIIENFDSAGWLELDGYLQKLKGINASLREVKETKQRLVKTLKVDKEDRETEKRFEEFFGWKKLVDKYEIKTLEPKLSKRWMMGAASNLNLLDVYLKLVSETTHAPDLLYDKRSKLEKYSSRLLGRIPDLAEKNPPKVTF